MLCRVFGNGESGLRRVAAGMDLQMCSTSGSEVARDDVVADLVALGDALRVLVVATAREDSDGLGLATCCGLLHGGCQGHSTPTRIAYIALRNARHIFLGGPPESGRFATSRPCAGSSRLGGRPGRYPRHCRAHPCGLLVLGYAFLYLFTKMNRANELAARRTRACSGTSRGRYRGCLRRSASCSSRTAGIGRQPGQRAVGGRGPACVDGRPNLATRSGPPAKTVMRAMPAGVTVRTPRP